MARISRSWGHGSSGTSAAPCWLGLKIENIRTLGNTRRKYLAPWRREVMTNIAPDHTQRAKVYETWLKCLRLSNDSTTTGHERQAAQVKSIKLRKQLDATAPATNLAGFRALVKQGKALLEEQENINWKLGE